MRVRALRRKESNLKEVKWVFSCYSDGYEELFSRIEWVAGDLLDVFSLADALEGVSHIYHCAALVSMDASEGAKMILNNVNGTANLVNLALEKKIRKFCHVSSVAALGIEKGKEITEETAWNDESNGSAYAISKYLAENEVWRASQEGLNVVMVNPTIVLGPGNWNRSSGLIFKAANKGLRWYTSGSMAYVDARDVVKAMMLLMESKITGERVIVSAENMSYKNFLEMVYSALGKAVPNKRTSKLLLALAWRLDGIRSMLTGSAHIFTQEVARYARKELRYSNQKIKRLLQLDFIPIGESIKETSKHYLLGQKRG